MSNRTKAYNREKNIITFVELGLTGVYFYFLLVWGGASFVANLVRGWTAQPLLQFLLFSLIVGGIFSVVSFPLSVYSEFILEHKYGLSRQTLWQWLWDKTKGLLVSSVISLPILLAFYYLLKTMPDWWWLWLGILLALVTVVLAQIAPVLIFPLFYKFKPLENQALVNRLQQLLNRYGFQLEGLYQFDMSSKTVKANAAFTGMGKTRRIILGDTLLEKFSEDEIEFVIAHEVGHFVHRHLLKGIAVNLASIFIGLYLVHLAYQYVLLHAGISDMLQLEYLPYLGLFLFLFSLVVMPLTNGVSRRFEFQADAFAVRAVSNPQAAVSTLEKLAEINLTDPNPNPLIEFFFHSHPSISRRVQAIQKIIGGSHNAVATA